MDGKWVGNALTGEETSLNQTVKLSRKLTAI